MEEHGLTPNQNSLPLKKENYSELEMCICNDHQYYPCQLQDTENCDLDSPQKLPNLVSHETLLNLFKKQLTNERHYIECFQLKDIFITYLNSLGSVANKEIERFLDSISDFIPKKVSEQAFSNLLSSPEINRFLSIQLSNEAKQLNFDYSKAPTKNSKMNHSVISLESFSIVRVKILNFLQFID